LVENHQKAVNVQVDECRQLVEFSVDKIMGVIEQKFATMDPAPAAAPRSAHMNIAAHGAA
jgi:hypothetical protein